MTDGGVTKDHHNENDGNNGKADDDNHYVHVGLDNDSDHRNKGVVVAQ